MHDDAHTRYACSRTKFPANQSHAKPLHITIELHGTSENPASPDLAPSLSASTEDAETEMTVAV